VEVRIRLGNGIARFSPAPRLRLELPDGSTVDDLFACLAADHPELAPALRSALPVLGGVHVERAQTLKDGDELGVLTPVAGGAVAYGRSRSNALNIRPTIMKGAGHGHRTR
jgi:molybdopterin converting factor small subunit